MTEIVLVIHLLIAIAMIAVVLLQKSEGGALGIGGGGGGGGNLFSSRGTANLLTRTTAMLAVAFFATSFTLTFLSKGASTPDSVLDTVQPQQQGDQPKSNLPVLPGANTPTTPQVPAE